MAPWIDIEGAEFKSRDLGSDRGYRVVVVI